MKPGWGVYAALIVAGLALGAAVLSADTLVLRDGRRIQGDLVSVQNDVIQFRERRGSSGRLLRFSRGEVQRIEFEYAENDYGRPDTGGPPRGMRERNVTVAANRPWTDTGVDVRSGQTVYFAATGEVVWGRGRRDGPEGEKNSPFNPARPIPSRPGAALIGRIGESSDYFFIGNDQGPIRLRSSGRLYLGPNDEYLNDNSGYFRVIVYY